MIPLDQFRKSLGKYADTLSEKEIEQTCILLDHIANVVVDNWFQKRKERDLPATKDVALS